MTPEGARPKHLATPDPLDNPSDWVLTYLVERDKLPNWWPEFQSLQHRDVGPLSDAQVQELAQKQAMAFRLPTAQREKSGWWNAPPSLAGLGCQDFLPPSPSRPQDPRDIWMVRRDQMVGLVRALQQCAKQLGGTSLYTLQCSLGPPQMPWTPDGEGWSVGCLCARGCMGGACGFPNPYGGGCVIGRRPRAPRRSGNSPAYPVWVEDSEPEDTVSPGVMAAVPQNIQRSILPPPLGFAQPLAFGSGPPLLENVDTPVGIPRGTQTDLASLSSPHSHL